MDAGGAASVRDGKKSKEVTAEPEEESTYYDAMKQEMAGRAARTKSALDALAPHQRISMEGHRAGTYMRLRFKGLPIFFASHPLQVYSCGNHIKLFRPNKRQGSFQAWSGHQSLSASGSETAWSEVLDRYRNDGVSYFIKGHALWFHKRVWCRFVRGRQVLIHSTET